MAETMRLAAVGDLHCAKTSQGQFRSLFFEISERADILALCGDLVDYGLPEEARILLGELGDVVSSVPIVAVLGNHEFESGREAEIEKMFSDSGIVILDGDACEIKGIGFAGVKGFGGGFGDRVLEPWGEEIVKQFVRESVEESLKLESALAKLRTPHRIALLHYSPIRETVEGEPREIFPFLGSSRLEEPLNRYPVFAAFHGHAHHGTLEGRTQKGVPVYNVAMKLLQYASPEAVPYKIIEVPLGRSEAQGRRKT